MPLYEYQCPQCGRFELIRKFSDAPLKSCPTCGRTVHKLPSAPAIQFKGTGWYVTDYARKSAGGDGSAKGAEAPRASKEAPGAKEGSATPASTPAKDGAATSKGSRKASRG